MQVCVCRERCERDGDHRRVVVAGAAEAARRGRDEAGFVGDVNRWGRRQLWLFFVGFCALLLRLFNCRCCWFLSLKSRLCVYFDELLLLWLVITAAFVFSVVLFCWLGFESAGCKILLMFSVYILLLIDV